MREELGKALRLDELGEEREKLLHAYTPGAGSVDLLRSEQDRPSTETSQAERHLEAAEAYMHRCREHAWARGSIRWPIATAPT